MGAPPEAYRFRKGRSGNPSGRPKASADTGQLLAKVLASPVTVTDRGRPKRMSQEEVVLRQLVSKAMKGDVAANRLIANLRVEGQRQALGSLEDQRAVHAAAREKIKRLFPKVAALWDETREPEEGSWLPPLKDPGRA